MPSGHTQTGGMNRRHRYQVRRPVSIAIELYDGEALVEGWDYSLEQADGAGGVSMIRHEPLTGGFAEVRNDPVLRSGECVVTFFPTPSPPTPSPDLEPYNFIELLLTNADGRLARGDYVIEQVEHGQWIELCSGPLDRGVAYVPMPNSLEECRVSFTPTRQPCRTTVIQAESFIEVELIDLAGEPVANHEYVIERAVNGHFVEIERGPLDFGRAWTRITEPELDECFVTFVPQSDTQPPAAGADDRIVVSLELFDENGEPAEGYYYCLEHRLADGRWEITELGPVVAGQAQPEFDNSRGSDYRVTFSPTPAIQ